MLTYYVYFNANTSCSHWALIYLLHTALLNLYIILRVFLSLFSFILHGIRTNMAFYYFLNCSYCFQVYIEAVNFCRSPFLRKTEFRSLNRSIHCENILAVLFMHFSVFLLGTIILRLMTFEDTSSHIYKEGRLRFLRKSVR